MDVRLSLARRTLATDRGFKDRVREDMLVRLLDAFVWRNQGYFISYRSFIFALTYFGSCRTARPLRHVSSRARATHLQLHVRTRHERSRRAVPLLSPIRTRSFLLLHILHREQLSSLRPTDARRRPSRLKVT